MKIVIIIILISLITSIIINVLVFRDNIRKEKLIKKQKKLITNLVKFKKEKNKK